MPEARSRLTVEALLFGVVLTLAAVLRLTSLSWLPLTDGESVEALAAAPSGYELLSGSDGTGALPISPSYHLLTSVLFVLFGPSDIAARVLPAIAGTLLVAAPVLLRKRIGIVAALIASFLLATSPTLVAISRTAGGTSLSLLGMTYGGLLLVVAQGSVNPSRAYMGAGLCAALAIASGPSAYNGLVSIVVGGMLLTAMRRMPPLSPVLARAKSDWLKGLLAGLGGLVGLSYLSGATPGALTGMSSAAAAWLSGWGRLGELPGLTAVLMLPIYEPLVAVIGAAWAIVSARSAALRGSAVAAAILALSSLILVFAYPSRSPQDLAWVVIPLVLPAALALESGVKRMARTEVLWPSALLAIVLLLLAGFAYMQLTAAVQGALQYEDGVSPFLKTLLVAAPFLIAALIILVFGLGWSWVAAGEASVMAAAVILWLLSLSACWRISFPAQPESVELWRPTSVSPALAILKDTVESIAVAETGREENIGLAIRGQAPLVLAWTFYGPLVSEAEALQGQPPAPLEIVRETDLTEDMATRFTGQSFVVQSRWGWTGAVPPDFLRWWITRDAPTVPEQWYLLVPGGVGLGEVIVP